MADVDEKEKAEKLAAAKKRFEQLKKQQKGKKAGSKKKDDKTDSNRDDEVEDAAAAEQKDPLVDEPVKSAEPTAAAEADAPTTETGNEDSKAVDDAEDTIASTESKRPTGTRRQPSVSIQSKQRSESFRRGSIVAPSPGLAGVPSLDSETEVQDIYRKQAARIEELERENKSLRDAETKLAKAEEELEALQEGSRDIAELRSKAALADDRAKEVEKLSTDLVSTQRQLSQAQQSAASKNRRVSSASPAGGMSEQLASKQSTIESLELELSNLRNQISILESDKSSHAAAMSSIEQRASAAETAATNARDELSTLKTSISSSPSDTKKSESDDPTASTTNRSISLLESDLRVAQSAADAAVTRANSLEQKVEALTRLHRESANATLAREKEVKDLKARIASLTSSSAREARGGEDVEDLEDEERERLHSRIRDLEAETFELRRGVWRDQRAALQPSMGGGGDDGGATSPGYEDIDLNGNGTGTSSTGGRAGSPYSGRKTGSTFQDVLQSGLSAFTGREYRNAKSPLSATTETQGTATAQTAAGRQRAESLGLMSEDGFDEEAYLKAAEEEAQRRLERVREVKRGLDQWRGWRLDIADVRAGGLPGGVMTGPVFEV